MDGAFCLSLALYFLTVPGDGYGRRETVKPF